MWIPRPIYEAHALRLHGGCGAVLVGLAFHAEDAPHGLLLLAAAAC